MWVASGMRDVERMCAVSMSISTNTSINIYINIYRESHVIINNLSFSLTPSLSIFLTDNLSCNESAINSNKRLFYTHLQL